MPCFSNPNMMPLNTSPDPAVAKVGGAFALMIARPSGAAMTVSAPFKTITAATASGGAACTRELVAAGVEEAPEFAFMRRHDTRSADGTHEHTVCSSWNEVIASRVNYGCAMGGQ